MIKTYVVNVENKTIKDGMFNKPIKLSNRVNISNSSNIVYIDYRCDEPINEGFIKIETNKNNKLLIYKLPPQRIIMPSIVNPDKDKYVIWTNDCFIAYYNSEWYLSYKNRLLPFFMTNVFWGGCDIVLNDMDFVRICHGRTLNNKSTSLEAIISNFKSYIITILQGQPNTDLHMRGQFIDDIGNESLRRYIDHTYKYLTEQQKDIKTQEEARKWYSENYNGLPRVINDFYKEEV